MTDGRRAFQVVSKTRLLERDFGSQEAVVSFQFSVVSRNSLAKQKGHPGKGAAFSFRENSSNGAKSVKTFWRNLMSRKRGVSRNFWEINIFVFNNLQNRLTELDVDSF
jgi:hypothetical protein